MLRFDQKKLKLNSNKNIVRPIKARSHYNISSNHI